MLGRPFEDAQRTIVVSRYFECILSTGEIEMFKAVQVEQGPGVLAKLLRFCPQWTAKIMRWGPPLHLSSLRKQSPIYKNLPRTEGTKWIIPHSWTWEPGGSAIDASRHRKWRPQLLLEQKRFWSPDVSCAAFASYRVTSKSVQKSLFVIPRYC